MIKIYAPASIGNLSLGFDVLGMAVSPINGKLLGDVVSIKAAEGNQNSLEVIGEFVNKLPVDIKDNIVFQCMALFEQKLVLQGLTKQAVHLQLEKNMPVGSGLGSSACSVVAALVALNEFYQRPFNQAELLSMMGAMEAHISGSVHYDNVAPCYLGGLQLMVANEQIISRQLPDFKEIYWLMAYPGISVSTKMAREVLPETYSRSTLITFGQNLASFIDACYRQDSEEAMSYVNDVVAEPYRRDLIPRFTEAKQYVMAHGALAAGISGSGPTLFVACDKLSVAQDLADYLQQNYLQSAQGFVHICQTDTQGARTITANTDNGQ
ncbi:homoserine kinase [Thalassotalea maritima]|uniref:homoserine kinase n=1 Tax=Thalassotalea maritima TaxID=3242416 RepID=UPI00352841B2